MALLPPIFQQDNEYSARMVRQLISAIANEGVVEGGLAVTERGLGANMSVDVSAGRAFVAGDDSSYQGTYLCVSDGIENLAVPTADAILDRIDLVVAQVLDADGGAASGQSWVLDIVEGTPANPPAAPAVPDSAIPLAEILVENGVTSITDGDITDVAPVASATFTAVLG